MKNLFAERGKLKSENIELERNLQNEKLSGMQMKGNNSSYYGDQGSFLQRNSNQNSFYNAPGRSGRL